uniref:Ig-like domain-containing protein n=1 Tax=Gopherus agassizii TaxID=38772 RepID=A0A452HIA6_9SAUR
LTGLVTGRIYPVLGSEAIRLRWTLSHLLVAPAGPGLTVLQSPAALRASPGETAALNCSFENTQGSLAKATWTRAPGAVLDSAHPFYRGRLRMSHLDLLQKGEATLTLSGLEQRDSGLYQCHISIRKGESGRGAGTELLVTRRNQSDTGEVGNAGTGPSPAPAPGQGSDQIWGDGVLTVCLSNTGPGQPGGRGQMQGLHVQPLPAALSPSHPEPRSHRGIPHRKRPSQGLRDSRSK